MSTQDDPPRIGNSSALTPEMEAAVRKYVTARVSFWSTVVAVPAVFAVVCCGVLFFKLQSERKKVARELEALKAEAIRFGQRVEIHNPTFGTVIDGVDPAKFPSRDPRDPRRGALVQQYVHNGREAQVWELRPAGMTNKAGAAPTNPTTVAAFLKRGFELLHKERQPAFAIEMFESCIRQHPESSECHHGLAQAEREAGHFDKALKYHNRAIELAPNRPEYHWERGVTQMRMNDFDGAITDFNICLEHDPNFANGEMGLATAYRGKGDLDAALTHHDKAIELKPEEASFYRERSITYQRKGDGQRAGADLMKANELAGQK